MKATNRTIDEIRDRKEKAAGFARANLEELNKAEGLADGARNRIGDVIVEIDVSCLGDPLVLLSSHDSPGAGLRVSVADAKGLAGWLNRHVGCNGPEPEAPQAQNGAAYWSFLSSEEIAVAPAGFTFCREFQPIYDILVHVLDIPVFLDQADQGIYPGIEALWGFPWN